MTQNGSDRPLVKNPLCRHFRLDQAHHRVPQRVQHELLGHVGRPQLQAEHARAKSRFPGVQGRNLRQEKNPSRYQLYVTFVIKALLSFYY